MTSYVTTCFERETTSLNQGLAHVLGGEVTPQWNNDVPFQLIFAARKVPDEIDDGKIDNMCSELPAPITTPLAAQQWATTVIQIIAHNLAHCTATSGALP